MRAKFKDPKEIAALNYSLCNVACALGSDELADFALDGLASALEDLMSDSLSPGNVTVPHGPAAAAWADDPAIVDLIGPLPVNPPGLARPNPAFPSITSWELPQALLEHLDLQMHSQPGSAAAHVGVAKRLGHVITLGAKRSRLRDGITAKIMASPGTPGQVAADVDARAAAAEVEIIGPRILKMFFCAHR